MSNSFADLLADKFPFEATDDAQNPADTQNPTDTQNAEGAHSTSKDPTGSEAVYLSANAGKAATVASDKVWETVVAAMLDVSDLPAEQYRPELNLAADFDLHPIARYAVVSRIEEDLKIKLKDTEVEAATSLADLVKLTQAALEK